MEDARRGAYEGLVRYLEEPIREVVPALWRLPFLADTGFTCSGHILSQSGSGYERYSRQNFWYPHRAMLEFAFSTDERTRELRDAFRKDLAAVSVEGDGLTLCFNRVSSSPQEYRPHSRIPESNLSEHYNADIPSVERSAESVAAVENLLGAFWERVGDVVRSHNPTAQIGPIRGKNFRQVINWADWGSVFQVR